MDLQVQLVQLDYKELLELMDLLELKEHLVQDILGQLVYQGHKELPVQQRQLVILDQLVHKVLLA